MIDGKHYVPILKGKQGELDALKRAHHLTAAFTPLLEIPPIPPKWLDGQEQPVPSKSIQEHVASVIARFQAALRPKSTVLIDGEQIEEDETLPDGQEPAGAVLQSLAVSKFKAVPVVGLDRVEEYVRAIAGHAARWKSGVCLRLRMEDLEGEFDLDPQITSLLEFMAVRPGDVDLLVDFREQLPPRVAVPLIIESIPRLTEWRSLTLASAAFPLNMVGIQQYSVVEQRRNDWLTWLSLQKSRRALARLPAYSDYTINHPDWTELDPRIMQMSPNIRYTKSAAFLIAKGEAYPKGKRRKRVDLQSVSPSVQYPKLAQAIMADEEWCGAEFSWGDLFIEGSANGKHTGNPTQWRAAGVNHHIVYVVQQLSKLREPEEPA